MKRFLKSIAVICGLILSLLVVWVAVGVMWPLDAPSTNPRADRLLIHDVAVVDVRTGRVSDGQNVLVDNGLIAAVGPDVSVPDASRIDGNGLFVIPGLFDMHVHTTRLSPVLMHPLFIANGVTAVRDMGGCIGPEDGFVACVDDKRNWSQAVAAGEMVGPRFDHITSLAMNGGQAIPNGMDKALGGSTVEGARQRVALDKSRGVDFLKTYTMLQKEPYFALAEAAAANDMYLAGHLPLAVSAFEAVAAGQRSIEHAFLFIWDCYPGMEALRIAGNPRSVFTNTLRTSMILEHDAALCSALHRRMAARQTAYVPTHTTRKLDAYATDPGFRSDPRLKYIPRPLRKLWLGDADGMARRAAQQGSGGQDSYMAFYRFGLEQTGLAHQAGVTVLAGSDTPDSFAFPGSALHDELEHLVQAGLSPLDALRAATLEPAKHLGLEGRAGVIEVGARADLVLLRANPLDDINAVREIESVVLAGSAYTREDLDRFQEGVETAANSWSMWPKFVWQILNSPVMKKQFAD